MMNDNVMNGNTSGFTGYNRFAVSCDCKYYVVAYEDGFNHYPRLFSLHEQRLKGCRFIAFLLAPVLLKSLIIFVTSPTENKEAADQ